MIRKLIYVPGLLMILLLLLGCGRRETGLSEERELERKVDSVLSLMTLEEKLGQLTLLTSHWDVTGPVMDARYLEFIRAGKCGNIFNAHTVAYNRDLQKTALEETRLGIPLLFGYDVIHGHRTIFPVPLAEACSWNLGLMYKSSALAAKEAAASGLNWTFAPMVDISRDPRWGRVTEGNGEDTYLSTLISEARVRGFQGDDLSDPGTIASCVKHFAAYGAPVAGRDYNSVDMSEISFRQDYLPPYQAGVEAGAATVMASFNDLFGVPATASRYLMSDILRGEWDFRGFVVSDYTGVNELLDHRVAENRKHAGELALSAGIDMDMQSVIFMDHLSQSVEDGSLAISKIDAAAARVLRIKFQLGLFDDPYRYLVEERESEVVHSQELMDHALQSARESVVLLKNEPFSGSRILPLGTPGSIAVIGPLGDSQLDMLGSWHAAGDVDKVVTLFEGLKKRYPDSDVRYVRGCGFYSDDRSEFRTALTLAERSDVVVLAIGEKQAHSGEAASLSDISIPGIQSELAQKIIDTGTPVVVLILAERPLAFQALNESASAILYGWHLGTRAGDALADILSGAYIPSGKLVMSIPRNTGQIPVYYNAKSTGRPFDPENKYTSKYLDVPNTPLYPFGYGLSYTSFEYGEVMIDKREMGMNDTLRVSVSVTNTGSYNGDEIIQLYVRDMVGSLTRPVKELKAFKKIRLAQGESRDVQFTLTADELGFVGSDLSYIVEPGEFRVFVGPDSENLKGEQFELR